MKNEASSIYVHIFTHVSISNTSCLELAWMGSRKGTVGNRQSEGINVRSFLGMLPV
jgi:hypothetical protein